MKVLSLVDPGFMTRMGVHYGLFMGALAGSGTQEQLQYWTDKGAFSLRGLIGCFGMTEMGYAPLLAYTFRHGSNVPGIETLATFDRQTDEFVIHTPTLTATKWWIGGAAESATHCCVFARMVVDGRDYEVKSFVVPLRNPETFDLMPGVNIGDMGMKMGRNAIDNGWIQFTNVRIPRTNLLMRHTKVARDGRVTEPMFPQLTYGALVHGRMAMIRESSDALKKALTIAVRFSCQRRQFGGGPGEEHKLMDYRTHQMRLLPLLASTFALGFSEQALKQAFDRNMRALEGATPADPNIRQIIDALKETHGNTAGLKAFST